MQSTSEHFQMYHFQRGLQVTTQNWGLLHCLQSLHDSQTEEPHTVSDPPVLHLRICPCLQKGHNSVRITNIHLTLNIGRTRDCKVKKPVPHGAAEQQFRLIYAYITAALHAPGTSLCNRNHDVRPLPKSSHLVTLVKANHFLQG